MLEQLVLFHRKWIGYKTIQLILHFLINISFRSVEYTAIPMCMGGSINIQSALTPDCFIIGVKSILDSIRVLSEGLKPPTLTHRDGF